MTEWERISSESVADYSIFRARRDVFRSPRTGADLNAVVLDGPDWVNVIAVTGAEEWVFVRQFRFGSRSLTLEIPGGMIDPGESPFVCAQRELLEETGCRSERWTELGWVYPNPAFQINRCYTFLAEDCQQVAALKLDPGEDIEVLRLSQSDVMAAALNGSITHSLVLVAIFFWQNRRAQGDLSYPSE